MSVFYQYMYKKEAHDCRVLELNLSIDVTARSSKPIHVGNKRVYRESRIRLKRSSSNESVSKLHQSEKTKNTFTDVFRYSLQLNH